ASRAARSTAAISRTSGPLPKASPVDLAHGDCYSCWLNPARGRTLMAQREAVIVATARTGLAKSFRGSFNLTPPDDMGAHCVKAVLKQTPQLDPKEIDDVVMGAGFPEGPQGFNVGRNVAVMAELPITVPGGTVSRFCSSGLNAVAVAAHMVQVEGANAVIGGGMESITMLQNDF